MIPDPGGLNKCQSENTVIERDVFLLKTQIILGSTWADAFLSDRYLIHSDETQVSQFHILKQQISPSHVYKLGFFVRARIS